MDSIKGLIEKLTDLANSDYARSAEGGRYYMGRSDGFSKAIAEVRDFFAASPAAPEPERGEGGGDPDWEAKEIRRRIDENKAICQQPIASGIEGGVGYRWVKCSERFPDFPFIRMMVLREIKQPFNKAVTNFSFDFQYNKVHFGKTAFNPEDVEWLEEYELFPQPTTSGEEKEVYDMGVYENFIRATNPRNPPPLTGNDLSDTNVGNIVQGAENQVTGNDVEGEAPEEITSNQLACEADMAAIEYGKEKNSAIVCECDECGNCWNGGSISADIAEAFEAGQSWMWRKMQEQIAAERKHAKYGLELLSDRCKELETQLSAASTRISELQRELSLEIDTRKVLSDQLAAEKSFNENSKALDEKNGMEAEGLRLSIQKLRDVFRQEGRTGIAGRINGLLTNK